MFDRDSLEVGKYIGEGKLKSFLEIYTNYQESSESVSEEIFNILKESRYENKLYMSKDQNDEKRVEFFDEIKKGLEKASDISDIEKNILNQLCSTLIIPDIYIFPEIEDIRSIVSDITEVSKEEMIIETRKGKVVQARQIAMFFSVLFSGKSLVTIGNTIGEKDHATVLHSKKTINNLIESRDKKTQNLVYDVYLKLKLIYDINVETIKDDEIRKNLKNLLLIKSNNEPKPVISLGNQLLDSLDIYQKKVVGI